MQYDDCERAIALQEKYYDKLSAGLSEADQDTLGRILNTSYVKIRFPDEILCEAAEEFVRSVKMDS
jgi:hypothetical protein